MSWQYYMRAVMHAAVKLLLGMSERITTSFSTLDKQRYVVRTTKDILLQ